MLKMAALRESIWLVSVLSLLSTRSPREVNTWKQNCSHGTEVSEEFPVTREQNLTLARQSSKCTYKYNTKIGR